VKLIVIYGPSAAGKHTVGRQLAKLTGYKFFYNHLTVDVVRAVFADDDLRRHDLLCDLRLRVIQEAVRYDLDMIFTVAYTFDKPSQIFMQDIINSVTVKGNSIHFVRLCPPEATLFERIGNESRRRLRKPIDREGLRGRLDDKERNLRGTIDYPSHINLDTSQLTPLQSARRIIKEFKL